MKKKAGVKLLAVLLATSTILSGCGAQETSSRGTSSKEERSDEAITPSTSASRETSKDADETAYAGSDAIIMLNPASVSISSDSVESSVGASDSVGTEGTVEDFPAINWFIDATETYKDIVNLLEHKLSDSEKEEFLYTYGFYPIELFDALLNSMEEARIDKGASLNGLHKFESVSTFEEFCVVFEELAAPQGVSLASLKSAEDDRRAERNAAMERSEQAKKNKDEAREFVDTWYWDTLTYRIGKDVEASEAYYYTSYPSYYDELYFVELIVVIPDDAPVPSGYSLSDLGLWDNGYTEYLYYPKTMSRADWGIPEEGTVLSNNETAELSVSVFNLAKDWAKANNY